MTDVIDELIGEFSLNSVSDNLHITQRDDSSWLADGQYPYYEFVNYFKLSDAEESEGFTTISGLILKYLHHYPVAGERIKWRNFELEVVDMDGTRIDKVLITKLD